MNRRSVLKGLVLTPTIAYLAGCGSSTDLVAPLPDTQTPIQPTIISASTAAALITSGTVLTLAAESKAESGELPLLGGAVKVDVDALTTVSEAPGALNNVELFAQLFRSWGVQPNQPIVIYDDGEAKFAARVHFLLLHFGAPPSTIVNGGAAALNGLVPVSAGSPASSNFVGQVVDEPIKLVFQQDVLARLNTSTKIVDVRSPAEFNGDLLLPGDARPGHIPGAINIPESEFFAPNGLLLDKTSLINLFAGRGLAPTDSVLLYCHDGAKSSLGTTLLADCDYFDISLYYLSYRDWSQNPNLPVEL